VIGIDNEELTRYLSRVALSSVARAPVRWAIRRRSCCIVCWIKSLCRFSVSWYRRARRGATLHRLPFLNDPAVIQAMHYIRNHACKGIKVDQVLDAVGISRSNLEKRFKEEVGETIHAVIHAKSWKKRAACWSPRCRSTKFRRCAATRRCNISIRCFERVRRDAEGVPDRTAKCARRKALPWKAFFSYIWAAIKRWLS
jgi:AraC-like DNA-binding protein